MLNKQSSQAREAKKSKKRRSTKSIVLSLLWTGFHKAPLGSCYYWDGIQFRDQFDNETLQAMILSMSFLLTRYKRRLSRVTATPLCLLLLAFHLGRKAWALLFSSLKVLPLPYLFSLVTAPWVSPTRQRLYNPWATFLLI